MNHDVAIVGGGIAGATLGVALGAAGMRVALVEARPPASEEAAAEDPLRVSALTPASQRILERLGVWGRIAPPGVSPFSEMRVWEVPGKGEIHFDAAGIGLPALGFIVENRALAGALEAALSDLAPVRRYRPATLEGMRRDEDAIVLRIGRDRVRARLVVGADGSDSRVREFAAIAYRGGDFRQCALVATLHAEQGHADTAWQRFLPGGPLALLPLREGRVSIVWSTASRHALRLREMDERDFESELAAAIGHRLGPLRLQGRRGRFPLRHLQAERYVAERVALAGDAAHTIHPLAGQGVNLGLLDAAALAQVLIRNAEAGRDLGRCANLRAYERWRKGHNRLMHQTMMAFHVLFGRDLDVLRRLRNLGLHMADRSPALKRFFMRFATGQIPDLPDLARTGP